jgi:hypothetical protein
MEQALCCLNSKDAFIPPNPKEFERTILSGCFLAWFGT